MFYKVHRLTTGNRRGRLDHTSLTNTLPEHLSDDLQRATESFDILTEDKDTASIASKYKTYKCLTILVIVAILLATSVVSNKKQATPIQTSTKELWKQTEISKVNPEATRDLLTETLKVFFTAESYNPEKLIPFVSARHQIVSSMYFTEFSALLDRFQSSQNIKLEVDRVKLYVEMQAQFLQISNVHHLRAENTVNRENRIHLSFWKLFLFGICIGMCYRFLDWAREMECKGARMIADKVLTMENERLASLGIYAVTDTELSSLSFVQIPASQLTLVKSA